MSFWEEQCPARGAGLTHQHDLEDCGLMRNGIDHPLHDANQCCECGHREGWRPAAVVVVVMSDRADQEEEPSALDRELDEIVEKYWREHGGEG